MSNDTELEGNLPEDNKVISGLREDLKDALKAVKTAGIDAIAKVERVRQASSLMPEGFEGFSDVFESEVDGELTEASAAEWLKGRGFSASSDAIDEEAASKAAALEEVTNLGGAVAAAGNLTPDDAILTQLDEIPKHGSGPVTLADVTLAMEQVLKG